MTYTLEQHLASFNTPDYQILSSIWLLNKKQIPLAQQNIYSNFPHYSMHEQSHSLTILKNIESFLGEERIRKLTPTDTFLLLMASFTHDLGMVVFYSTIEKNWKEVSFQNYLQDLSSKSIDNDFKKAASLLLSLQGNTIPTNEDLLKLPVLIRKYVIIVVAEYYRRMHHTRSMDLITGKDVEFHSLLNGFYMGNLPNRFSSLLGDIAYCHGIDFYDVLNRLEYKANGISNDLMHPRFIAFMLRLGDLLDVDDKRFNVFSEKIMSESLPLVSDLHRQKHAATKHLLISPTSIEVTVDCKSDEVYRIAREWFDWMQIEFENQSKEWAQIVPLNLGGFPPIISKGKIKILYNSVEPKNELLNLRFSISQKKIFEILEGASIYENPGFVFIREIVQNAYDATKIQLWKLIKSGLYDFEIGYVNSIIFPSDFPSKLYRNFYISLDIYWDDSEQKFLVIEMTDNGTGITESTLLRMTQKVGESRSIDLEYQTLKDSMPYWMKPTGAFGIGLQSIFLIAKHFTIHTKSENEDPKEIVFYSAKNGEYSKITDIIPRINRGTKVIVKIPREDLVKTNSKVNSNIIDDYDHFDDEYGDIFIHQIKHYILKYLDELPILRVNMMGNTIKEIQLDNSEEEGVSFFSYRDEKIKITGFQYEDGIYLDVDEVHIGSHIKMVFFKEIIQRHDDYFSYMNGDYYVRGIPTTTSIPHYHRTTYFSHHWNLTNTESDKILNISRDKLLQKPQRETEDKFLIELLPVIIDKALMKFEESFKPETYKDFSFIYFQMELTAIMCDKTINSSSKIYGTNSIPKDFAFTSEDGDVKYRDFFNADHIYSCSELKGYQIQETYRKKEDFLTFLQELNIKEQIVLWSSFFAAYIRSVFILTSYQLKQLGNRSIVILGWEKKQINSYKYIDMNDAALSHHLKPERENMSTKRRRHFLPIRGFKELAVKREAYDGFYHHGDFYSNHYIISPFKGLNHYQEVKKLTEEIIINSDDTAVIRELKTIIIPIIPSSLIKYVKEKSSHPTPVTEEMIFEGYAKLILAIFRSDKENKAS